MLSHCCSATDSMPLVFWRLYSLTTFRRCPASGALLCSAMPSHLGKVQVTNLGWTCSLIEMVVLEKSYGGCIVSFWALDCNSFCLVAVMVVEMLAILVIPKQV